MGEERIYTDFHFVKNQNFSIGNRQFTQPADIWGIISVKQGPRPFLLASLILIKWEVYGSAQQIPAGQDDPKPLLKFLEAEH